MGKYRIYLDTDATKSAPYGMIRTVAEAEQALDEFPAGLARALCLGTERVIGLRVAGASEIFVSVEANFDEAVVDSAVTHLLNRTGLHGEKI